MAVLILAANTSSPISLTVEEAGESQPTEIGSVTQSFNGADRSSVRGVKRNYTSLTTYADTSTKDSIINLLKYGTQIACSGDLLANIQTQSTVRYTGCRMVAGTSPVLWKVGLALSEVQPNIVLLKYAPGDTITGESFSRSTTAYQINATGVLESKAINVKRDGHYINGVRCLLLEAGRTNNLLRSTDFSNAAWAKTTMTVGTGIADPAGGTTACTLTATGANALADQTLATGSSIVRTNGVWIKRRTGSGNISLVKPDNSSFTVLAVTSSWQRFSTTGAASINRKFTIQIATSGDAVDVWNGQLEDGSFATSDIVTTSAAVTRNPDLYSLPFTPPPGEMSIYEKFVELGTISTANARLFAVADTSELSPSLVGYAPSGLYTAVHTTSAGFGSSALAAAPTLNDVVEILERLFGTGAVDLTQSINSAAGTASVQSGALALATGWSGPLCWLNSAGSAGFTGFAAIQRFKIVAGMRSLDEMRAA